MHVPPGATDASMTPYHVTRSKLFVSERFGKASLTHIDTLEIQANIEHTRFPVPEHEQHASTADYHGLLRAAYPSFFWNAVRPFIGDALKYLRVTQEGKQWIANLYAHVFSEEHRGALGA